MSVEHLSSAPAIERLVAEIDEALGLLEEFTCAHLSAGAEDLSPGSLLEQCLELCAQQEAIRPEPIRLIHHFACTGGTLMTKCIAAMPNMQILSEVDPLSTMQLTSGAPRFAPTDMVRLVRGSTQGADPELIIKMFLNNLGIIYSESIKIGQRLVVRDHAHSHFCFGAEIGNRPSLREIVASRFPVLSIVSVRHPLDSFLSIKREGWIHFDPATFDEYCKRYLAFLDRYNNIPVIRYEDFVRAPCETMRKICSSLTIPFSSQFINLFSVFKLSGDSGRRGNTIEFKARRQVEKGLLDDLSDSPNYQALLAILKYEK